MILLTNDTQTDASQKVRIIKSTVHLNENVIGAHRNNMSKLNKLDFKYLITDYFDLNFVTNTVLLHVILWYPDIETVFYSIYKQSILSMLQNSLDDLLKFIVPFL